MMTVIVTSRVRDGCLPQFLAACAALKPLVLAEEGCLAYEHLIGVPWPPGSEVAVDPNRVVLVELWSSDELLRRHGGAAHGKIFAQTVRPLRESVVVDVFRSALPLTSDQLDASVFVQPAGLIREPGVGHNPSQR